MPPRRWRTRHRSRRPRATPSSSAPPPCRTRSSRRRRRVTRTWRPTSARTCTSTPTRPTSDQGPGPLGIDPEVALDVLRERMRVGHLRPPGRIVTICVGTGRPTLRHARPGDARRAGQLLAARPRPARPGPPVAVQRLRRRRLLLPRRPRPGRHPDHDGHVYVVGETGAPGFALVRDDDLSDGVGPRATRSSPRCRTGTGGCGSPRRPAWSAGSIPAPAACVARHRRGDRQLVRRRRARRRLRRHATGALSLRRRRRRARRA